MRHMLIAAVVGIAACSVPQQNGTKVTIFEPETIGPSAGVLSPLITITALRQEEEKGKEKKKPRQNLASIKNGEDKLCDDSISKDDIRIYVSSRLDCAVKIIR